MKSKAIRVERTRTLTLLLRALFSGALPFLLAATRMLGALSPFSAAFTGAADVSMLIPAAIGATAGIFVFRPEHIPLRVVTVLLICALRFLLQRLLKKKSRPLLNALLVFGAGGVSLTFYSLLNHLSTASYWISSSPQAAARSSPPALPHSAHRDAPPIRSRNKSASARLRRRQWLPRRPSHCFISIWALFSPAF